MKINLFLIIFLFIQVLCKISELEKKSLLLKYAHNLKDNEISFYYDYDDEFTAGIPYDPKEIQDIIKKYNFPETYNFFEANGIQPVIKNQASCGSCWSFSSTSSLAYRYKKLGINIDLSPQYALSCSINDCVIGNNYIDSQLNLVKNGTTTEKCFPYASSDGKYIPTCPKQCLNESLQFKKYFAKNTYALEPVKTSPDLYDVIAIIMDELITYGPMYAGLRIFNDFKELHKNATKCAETIYHHDGNFEDESGHAVTLVGYGFENNKYYWLMQNSWGENDCDHGFFKIEFGQVNAEKVSFSEP